MEFASVVFTKSIRVLFENPRATGWTQYTADKGQVMAFLFLGTCPQKEMHTFDAIAALKAMGWAPPEGLEEAIAKEQSIALENPD